MIRYNLLLLLIMIKKIDNKYIAKITVTENKVTNPLIDLQQLLIEKEKYDQEKLKKYMIYPQTDNKPFFSLDRNKLYVTNIDREQICPNDGSENSFVGDDSCTNTDCCVIYSFKVESRDQTHSYHLLITILDENDNFPMFLPIKSPFITLPENSPINTAIELPAAKDIDSPAFGIKRYSISMPFLEGNASHFMLSDKISHGRPNLIVVSNLDRETVSIYRFMLKAIDRDNEVAHEPNDVEVVIKIADANDNSPVFDRSLYSASVKEHSRTKEVMQFKVTDLDEGVNSEVSVSIDAEREIAKLFRVEFSKSSMIGSIRLMDELDYETQKHIFEFNIVAVDNGRPQLTSTAKVKVIVTNENDHAPSISIIRHGKVVMRSIKITENEPSGTIVAVLQVEDKDSPVSNIDCQLLDSHMNFNIRPTNEDHPILKYKEYTIRTMKVLDREEADNNYLAMTINCNDHDKDKPLNTNLTVSISIDDINDNPPVFSRTRYQGELTENSAQSTVKMIERIRTTDKDYGKYSLVTYKIDSSEKSTDWQLFSIDSSSGTIYAKATVDFEEKRLFQFTIRAIDMDNSSLWSTAFVDIYVIDANDNAPVFNSSHYQFYVRENIPLNTIIGQIFASDADTKPENRNVKYFAKYTQNMHPLINVDQNTGQLRTIGLIDREKMKTISMLITAKNEAGYQSTNLIDPECMVVFVIEDENDNAPIFTVIHPGKTTVTFDINTAYKHDNCQQIPYSVSDPDQDESSPDDCCTMRLDNDYSGSFFLTATMPNFLCLRSTVTTPQTVSVTLIASDNKNNQTKSMETKISFNVLIKHEVTESNSPDSTERIPNNKIFYSKGSSFSLIIVIVVVVIVCLLIIAFVLLILYRYVVNSSEDIPKRRDDNTIQSTENNIIKMEYNQNLWPPEESKLMYQVNTQRKNTQSFSKPIPHQEWYFEKPLYGIDSMNSYQTMSIPHSKFSPNIPVNYEPFIPVSGQDYVPINNTTANSNKYNFIVTKDGDTCTVNTCNDNNQTKYCQTSFV